MHFSEIIKLQLKKNYHTLLCTLLLFRIIVAYLSLKNAWLPPIFFLDFHSLWFCITLLCDWFTKLAPLFQPMGIQTKTNRVLAARVFPRLAPVTCICFEF